MKNAKYDGFGAHLDAGIDACSRLSIKYGQNVVSSERGLDDELLIGRHQCLNLLALSENVSLKSPCLAKSLVSV